MSEDKGQFASRDLLVLCDVAQKPLSVGKNARDIRHSPWQADGSQMGFNTERIVHAAQIHARREPVRQRHADGDTLAMDETPAVIGGGGLERMAESMPQVEQRAIPEFEFVP